jgi:hypothetical protein
MACCPGPTPAMLIEAEKAYHQLMMGQAVVEVTDQNGEKVKFASAKRNDLFNYISSLRAQLCTDSGSSGAPSGPVGFFF